MGVLDRVLLFIYSLAVAWLILMGAIFRLLLEIPTLMGAEQIFSFLFGDEEIFSLIFILKGNLWVNIFLFGSGLGLLILSIRFIWLSVKRERVQEKGIDQETEIGAVHISLTTIKELVIRAAKQVKGIFNLRARVHYDEERSNLRIGLKVEIDGKRTIQSLTQELQQTVKDQVESIAGVEVDQISVFISQTNQSDSRNRLRVS